MVRQVTFVVFQGFELLDLSGPLAVFSGAATFHGAPFALSVVSARGGPVQGTGGVSLDTMAPAGNLGDDTLVVVGGPTGHDPDQHPDTVALLRSHAGVFRRTASVCTGAFLLASAGILDERRATTHWRFAGALQNRFPRVRVDADRIFIKDGQIWTSAGVTAGVDLALALVEEDCGPEIAKAIARDLVVYYRRPGGQSQFSSLLELEPASSRIKAALSFARAHIAEPLPVERLADAACVSPRQFGRLFVSETGETPARVIERLRVETARHRVEDGMEPLDRVAREAGFGDTERMRRSFVRIHGQTPQAIRLASRWACNPPTDTERGVRPKSAGPGRAAPPGN